MHDRALHTDPSGEESNGNAPNTLTSFLQNYVFFSHGFDEIGCHPHGRLVQTPVLRTYENGMWQDFYRLHDNFEGLREAYRRFQARYGNHQGRMTNAVAQSCESVFEAFIGTRVSPIGDITELFSPLDASVDHIARFLISCGDYHHVPPPVRNVYEDRLCQELRTVSGYDSRFGLRVQQFAAGLWESHLMPERLIRQLDLLVSIEVSAAEHARRISSYEYARACNGSERHERFARNALRELQHAHGVRGWQTYLLLPSLEHFRRMLPADLDTLDPSAYHRSTRKIQADVVPWVLDQIIGRDTIYSAGRPIEYRGSIQHNDRESQ